MCSAVVNEPSFTLQRLAVAHVPRSGKMSDLLKIYGIDRDSITQTVRKMLSSSANAKWTSSLWPARATQNQPKFNSYTVSHDPFYDCDSFHLLVHREWPVCEYISKVKYMVSVLKYGSFISFIIANTNTHTHAGGLLELFSRLSQQLEKSLTLYEAADILFHHHYQQKSIWCSMWCPCGLKVLFDKIKKKLLILFILLLCSYKENRDQK